MVEEGASENRVAYLHRRGNSMKIEKILMETMVTSLIADEMQMAS
jgi:hypothetical protein